MGRSRRAPATTSTTSPLPACLNAIGRAGEAPVPPLNLVGDFGGGGMLLAFGIACGLIEARTSGRGQVVDAAMIDGAALLATMFAGFLASGQWSETRGANWLDSGAPWYDTYSNERRQACRDRRDRAAVLRRAAAATRTRCQDAADAARPRRLASAAQSLRRTLRRHARATNGARRSTAATPASRRCCRSANRAAIPTSRRVQVASIPAASPSRHRRRASVALPAASSALPPERGAGGAEALCDWGFDAAAIESLRRLGVAFAASA